MHFNNEDVPHSAKIKVIAKRSCILWKFLLIVITFSALILVTGATGGNPDKTTVSLESDLWSNLTEEISLTEAQVKMSKLGTLNYGELSSGEKLFLFSEFKSKHKKKVILMKTYNS